MFDVNTAAKLAALDGQVFLDETEDTYCVWRTEYHRGLCTYYMDLFRRRGDGDGAAARRCTGSGPTLWRN